MTTIYGTDSLDIVVTVTDEATGSPKNITGATVAAAASRPGDPAIAATTSVQNGAAGTILVSFAAGAFLGKPGAYTCHTRVTLSGKVQTVAVTTFTVNASVVAA